jgi:hypothetical protein
LIDVIFFKSHLKITSSLSGGCGSGSDSGLGAEKQSDSAKEVLNIEGGSELEGA